MASSIRRETQKRELSYVSEVMPTVEVNGSFHSLLHLSACTRWVLDTTPSFVFSLKASRFITRMKRLRDCETPLANFFAAGVLLLGEKLLPVLFQLPPQMSFEEERVAAFLRLLPRTMGEAAELARTRHDARAAGRAFWDVDARIAKQKLRYAFDVRHPSFQDHRFTALLRAHGVALCVADTAGLFSGLRGRDGGLRVRATARRHEALRERLHAARPRAVGGSDRCLEQWHAG